MQIGECFTNQVIVGLEYNEDDLYVYFPTDGQLGVEYATKNNLVRIKDESGKVVGGGYLDPNKRNIKALKLRGEKSDGLVMPLSSLSSFTDISELKEGDMIDVLNGVEICRKYVPLVQTSSSNSSIGKRKNQKKKQPEVLTPIFFQHKDTAQLAYNLDAFRPGDIVEITLKMHGTSHRTANSICVFHKRNFLDKVLHREGKEITKWEQIDGTRRVVLDNFSGGFYGNNDFRKQHSDKFKKRLNKGECCYYEIVGYVNETTPIMGVCNNKKINDKEFVKKYGDTTVFSYGCEPGESAAYVYRMTLVNEDGHEVDYPYWYMQYRCEQIGVPTVPLFERFVYTDEADLLRRVNQFYEGADPVGKTHVREGVVVRIVNRNTFTAFKHKNHEFKVLEGIVKENSDQPDMEEIQEAM